MGRLGKVNALGHAVLCHCGNLDLCVVSLPCPCVLVLVSYVARMPPMGLSWSLGSMSFMRAMGTSLGACMVNLVLPFVLAWMTALPTWTLCPCFNVNVNAMSNPSLGECPHGA